MPRDELRQPLRRRSLAERLWARRPNALVAASIAALAVFGAGGVWLARQPHPFAGEPIVSAAIPPAEQLATASTDAAPPVEAEATPAEEEQIVEEPPPEAPAEEATIIVAARRPMKAAPIGSVTEKSDDGPLPKIASNGRTPADVYAQVTPMGIMASERPKIAVVLGGMGLNAKLTARAIRELPGDVTFAFAPYGGDLQSQVNRARAEGHEVMLQLPMEPMGYPANDPGPNTLLAEAPGAENIASLRWNMSRFAGYTGIVNYMGARFLSSPSGMQPVFAEMKKRGLLFLEDASLAMSATRAVAQATGLKARNAEVIIDADPDPAKIRAALAALEEQARLNGIAIGTGTGLAVTIETVADWARELERKGFVLVPASAAFQGFMG